MPEHECLTDGRTGGPPIQNRVPPVNRQSLTDYLSIGCPNDGWARRNAGFHSRIVGSKKRQVQPPLASKPPLGTGVTSAIH
ncbi:hypothetical protein HAX54_020122 [Datura stramonium]|uniref:Uncharacterized protein n=1 Tax=Datura stramonium TaxID=4076 RepID=A0ABS8UQM0_DATST|nr:hypothetical protein [Datura stramonium]